MLLGDALHAGRISGKRSSFVGSVIERDVLSCTACLFQNPGRGLASVDARDFLLGRDAFAFGWKAIAEFFANVVAGALTSLHSSFVGQ